MCINPLYNQKNYSLVKGYLCNVEKYSKIYLLIYVSTDKVYGNLCPFNSYEVTKADDELIAQTYYHIYKMRIIITICNNLYELKTKC